MECPKCGIEISDNTIVCPNCKKVLKVVCPVCKSLNDSNTCKKCGYVILTKCYNCGKVNLTENKRCKKCNYPLNKSVIQNEANTDDFVLLNLEFTNLDEIKNIFGSAKIYNKFKINLDKLIGDYAKSISVRRQIINKKNYVFRFLKDYAFVSSASSAARAVIDILNSISRLNCKLVKRKGITLKCSITLLKRSVNSDPDNYKSDFNIKLLPEFSGETEQKILNSYQVIVDDSVFGALNKDYNLLPLNSVVVNGEMKMFYEMNIKNDISIDSELLVEEDDADEIQIPNFVQNMLREKEELESELKREQTVDDDAIYDLESINFDEIQCDFIKTENIDVFYHMVNKMQSVPHGILAIKSDPLYMPYSLKMIGEIEKLKIYKNIISVTCYDEMKYSPYSFFRELVSAIFEFTVSQKLFGQNDFSAFASIDPKNLIKDLITLSESDIEDAFQNRNDFFGIFLTLMNIIPNTLIFIEEFDKIDASSYEIMKYLFEMFDQMKVSYLISYDKKFSLHKDFYSLLSKPYYTEITLKPTAFEKIINDNKIFYKEILNDFYFQRVAKYACGSVLFLDYAIQYLIESGIYKMKDDCVVMVNPKTIIIPSNLNRLIRRRLNLLKDEPNILRFLATILLLGTRIDMNTIYSLGYENTDKILDNLYDMGYIYFYNNCVYFPNYNLLRDNLLEVMNKIDLQKIANELFSKVLVNSMPSPIKAYLYTLLSDYGNAFLQWEKLANVNQRLGDYSSYLNCCNQIIKLLDSKNLPETLEEDVQVYKLKLYENISENLFEYIPEQSQQIAELTLKNLEHTANIDKLIQLCSRMIQGAIVCGRYSHALSLTHKVLSLIPNASLNPEAPNFNAYFFLMSLVHIEILFNMGALEDCIDIGYKAFDVINDLNFEKFKPEYIDLEDFQRILIRSVGFVVIANIIQLHGNISEFLNKIYSTLSFIPKSFDIFIQLDEAIRGHEVSVSEDMIGEDDFSSIVFNIIKAFAQFNDNPVEFAKIIYKAKILAKKYDLKQIEMFCDLLIGYAYVQINKYKKASSIIYKIIKTLQVQGMKLLEYLAWYFLSEMNIREQRIDVAYGMLNNSTIQLERQEYPSDYMLMLMKYSMFKVMMHMGNYDKAELCINQAKYLKQKYNINFNFIVDAEHYPLYNQNEIDKENFEEDKDEIIEHPAIEREEQ